MGDLAALDGSVRAVRVDDLVVAGLDARSSAETRNGRRCVPIGADLDETAREDLELLARLDD